MDQSSLVKNVRIAAQSHWIHTKCEVLVILLRILKKVWFAVRLALNLSHKRDSNQYNDSLLSFEQR